MKRPAPIPTNVWRQLPLAKQRLAVEGPTQRDHGGTRDAVIVLAAELRIAGATQEEALEVVREMPLDVPPNKERHYRKQYAAFVAWVYDPPDGIPILTGCPRSKSRSQAQQTSRLRSTFKPYCDAECAKTCPIRRGGAVPATALLGSPFENVWGSSLWASTQLGMEGKAIYERLASLAAVGKTAEEPVWASRRYIASRLGYQVTQTTITRRLTVMASLGLIALTNKRKGLYTVHKLTDEQVVELEAFLGTREKVTDRERDAKLESLAFAEWAWEWDDSDEMLAGVGSEE